MPDPCELRPEFHKHEIADAHFQSETAAYIKDAAQDIRDITAQFTKATDAQWLVLKEVREGIAQEKEDRKVAIAKEATAREVNDTKLKGRMDGAAKVLSILTILTVMVLGYLRYGG